MQVDGAPMAYGDQMLWTSMCSIGKENAPDTDWYSAPLQGLRVNQSVFTHDAETSAVFIRYEITNESNAPMHVHELRLQRCPQAIGLWQHPPP